MLISQQTQIHAVVCKLMMLTPYITIYPEGEFDYRWFGDLPIKATLIFSKNLGYNKSLARKRVNIHIGNEERIFTQGSKKSIWIKNTIDTSLETSDVEKIGSLLKIIYHSLLTIAEIEGWETLSFEKAYRLSIADKGNFIWHTQFKTNKIRSLKARLRISIDKDGKVPIIAEFFDKNLNPQFEIPIIDTFFYFVNWERVFVKPVWLDNEKFGFGLMDSQLLIYADTQARQSIITISEGNSMREEIEGQLRMLTFRQIASNKEYKEWINR
jgi:hypothetical protein